MLKKRSGLDSESGFEPEEWFDSCSLIKEPFLQAVKVDGCSRLQALFKVILPIMLPSIIAVFVFGFIGGWNELIAGTIFISKMDLWTIPVGLKTLIGKYNVEWGLMCAGGVMALIPTAIMFAFMQKYVVDGLTAGAVKE